MSLTSGTRLGPYEIVSQVGAGGMGEVYKATDTRLNRTIAIKVLPEHLAGDPQRLARFQREAQTISNLNHPHICALHDVGDENGTHFLVMEYVEGEALDQRLERGPVPLDDALEYSKQIADALEKAHHQGIVHRDLKPANVMITKSGVKLIDFGLVHLTAESASGSPLTNMPTQGDADLTAEGTVLGTFRYMAPEQVEGQEVDSRTDIYALCLVIYEMITGKKAIDGKTQASLIAAILKDKPQPLTELVPITPPQLDRVVQTGLEKDPDKRWQSAREVKHALEWIGLEAPVATVPEASPASGWRASTVAFALIAILTAVWALWPTPAALDLSMRFPTMVLPEGTSFDREIHLKLSPDGRKLAFSAQGSQTGIWVYDFTSGSGRLLPGTENAWSPFWAPDSERVAFGDGNTLRVVEVTAGNPRTIATVDFRVGSGTWNQDDVIVFGVSGGLAQSVLKRVSATPGADGEVSDVTVQDSERGLGAGITPYFLPDGEHFLYRRRAAEPENQGIFVGSINVAAEDQSLERLFPSAVNAVYVPPPDGPIGYILYMPEPSILMAQPFNQDRLELVGFAEVVADDVRQINNLGVFSAASNHLVYLPGERESAVLFRERQLTWYEPGSEIPSSTVGEAVARGFGGIGARGDGLRIAFQIGGPTGHIWMADLERDGLRTQTTFGGGGTIGPVWSPEGDALAFGRLAGGGRGSLQIFLSPVPGAPGAEAVLYAPEEGGAVPLDWSSDGRYLIYLTEADDNEDLWALPMDGLEPDGEPIPIVTTEYNEENARLSPEGQWLAYESDRQGEQSEIFVQALLGNGQPIPISGGGGRSPSWGSDERALFYIDGDDQLTRVELTPVGEGETLRLQPGPPVSLLQAPSDDYVVYDGGQRFLFMAPSGLADAAPTPVTFITDWMSLLEDR